MPITRDNKCRREVSIDETLIDDADAFQVTNSSISLQIGLEEPRQSNSVPSSPTSSDCVTLETDNRGVGYVGFEVISTETVKDGHSSFVIYKVLISGHGIEKTPGVVNKRYSEFESFNMKLKKSFPNQMQSVSFPGKVLIGNLKCETIAKRSRAFEQYLNHIMSVNEIRFSQEAKEFFYQDKIEEGTDKFLAKYYMEAIPIFEKCLAIQEKIVGLANVVKTVCSLVVCYQAVSNREKALRYSNIGLLCLGDRTDSTYYLPLLQTSIYLHWMLGREKTHLDHKLGELKSRGVNTDADTNLLNVLTEGARC